MKIWDSVWSILSKVDSANNTRMWRAIVTVLFALLFAVIVPYVTWSWCSINRVAIAIEETFPSKYISHESCTHNQQQLRTDVQATLIEVKKSVDDLKKSQDKLVRILLSKPKRD